MSQDNRLQYIPVDVAGDEVPGFDCQCGGWVYGRTKAKFAKCSKGVVHCLECQRPARRFRKGFTCSHG